MLWRFAGAPQGESAAFGDVAATSTVAPAAGWAATERLVPAYSDGTFRPNNAVTRQLLASTLFRLAGRAHAWSTYPSTLPSTVVFAH